MPEETVRIMCPKLTCRKILVVPVSSRGKTVRCKNCTTTIRVPAKPVAAAAPSEPPASGQQAA